MRHARQAGDGSKNFKTSTGIHSGDSTAAAEKFVPEFHELITGEGTYITAEEKPLSGHKPVNDRFTLLHHEPSTKKNYESENHCSLLEKLLLFCIKYYVN